MIIGGPHEFCDHCPGCRPALINAETGERYADDSPIMVKVNAMWNSQTTYEERKAFIAVTVHNSRTRHDVELAKRVVTKIQLAASQ